MKKILFSLLILTAVSCSQNSDTDKKRAELDNLKKEQASLREKITRLETELADADTSGLNVKSKIVVVTEMNPVPFNHYIEVQAKVEGEEDVTVSSETMGNITSLNVKAGDKVSKGDILAVVDDRIIRQGIQELQAQLDLVTQIYNKQKNLWDQKIGSEIQFLQAKTNKEALEKRMGSLQEQLDMTRIKSPINGTVDLVNIKVGQTMAPGVPAFRVVNLSSLKVSAEVAESYISKVKRGNDVLIYFP
ncbi:MAG TPA: efflux RND transporter periplasmic adaptor subunit, partial [Bacteroidia bacterium]|nr:efflux RND transporter periplasmic adaptor subunit [Bacteroidia bacterium]